MSPTRRDVFLSHASEDKDEFVRPFAAELERREITFWLDEAEIAWGDRITQRIQNGLATSQFVIVFLSKNFLGKHWPESELGAAMSRENADGSTVVLPLILSDQDAVLRQYPLLRLRWSGSIPEIVDKLERVLRTGRREDTKSASGEPTADGSLEIVKVSATREAEFDVKLRNLSDDTVYITRIVLRILADEGRVLPALDASARYEMPISNLSPGESTSLEVSHVIGPHGADRFLIATECTNVVQVRLTLEYNQRYSVSRDAWLWKEIEETPEDRQRQEKAKADRQRWLAATPPCLRDLIGEGSRRSADTTRLVTALEAAYAEPTARWLKTLGWFGKGSGRWSRSPYYEHVAEDVLMRAPLEELLAALASPEVTAEQLEGAARFFAGTTFRTKRGNDRLRVPEWLKKRLLEHAMQSADRDNRFRAQMAFTRV